MMDLLQAARTKTLEIARAEQSGKISPQQAAAQRRELSREISDQKTKIHAQNLKQVRELQEKIAAKWKSKLDAGQPQTDAEYFKAFYDGEKVKMELRLMSDLDLKQGIDDIKNNLELYALLPDRAYQLLDEAKGRRSGSIPGSIGKIDFLHLVSETQNIMKAGNFTAFYKNSAEWKETEAEANYLMASRDPDRIYIRNGDKVATFSITDELNRPILIDELLGRKGRPVTSMDKIAGLAPEPDRPLVIGFGATDQEAQAAMEREAVKYSGQDTF